VENSRPAKESVTRDGCRRRHQVHYNQGCAGQVGCAEHSREDYSVESDTTSVEDDNISDGSRQARGVHPRHTMHSHRHRRTSHRQRFDQKGSWMKPEKFNCHGSFETFLVQFEN